MDLSSTRFRDIIQLDVFRQNKQYLHPYGDFNTLPMVKSTKIAHESGLAKFFIDTASEVMLNCHSIRLFQLQMELELSQNQKFMRGRICYPKESE